MSYRKTDAIKGPDETCPTARAGASDEVIFSLVEGFVWVCWPGTSVSTRLGSECGITDAMRMFLAQGLVGERLANRKEPQGR